MQPQWCVSRTRTCATVTTRRDILAVVAIVATPNYAEAILELDDKTLFRSADSFNHHLLVKSREENRLFVEMSDGYNIGGKTRVELDQGLYPIATEKGTGGYLLYCPPFLDTDVWPVSLRFYELLHFRLIKDTYKTLQSPVAISESMVADVKATLAEFGVEVAYKPNGVHKLRVLSVPAGLGLLGLMAPSDTPEPSGKAGVASEDRSSAKDADEKTQDSEDVTAPLRAEIKALSDRLAEVDETNYTLTRCLDSAKAGMASQLLESKRQAEEIKRLNEVNTALMFQQDAWTSGFSPDATGLRRIVARFASMVDKTCEKMTDKDLCIICMTKPRDAALQPCGHLCCCADCSSTLRAQTNPKCPVCRGEFKDAVRVFT